MHGPLCGRAGTRAETTTREISLLRNLDEIARITWPRVCAHVHRWPSSPAWPRVHARIVSDPRRAPLAKILPAPEERFLANAAEWNAVPLCSS